MRPTDSPIATDLEILKINSADSNQPQGALIGAAQAVEHYEIARYGSLKRWAENLGLSNAVRLLDATFKEEAKTDMDLSALADASANPRAMQAAE